MPSKLLSGLADASLDVALLPVIDLQRLPGLRSFCAAASAADGPTLTVRLFSSRPLESMRTLACDVDSHTSVALARIILAERWNIRPAFIDFKAGEQTDADARLLIGDKVICDEPAGMPYQLDLGQAWKELTGLPFVFAVWSGSRGRRAGGPAGSAAHGTTSRHAEHRRHRAARRLAARLAGCRLAAIT